MNDVPSPNVTQLPVAWGNGDQQAFAHAPGCSRSSTALIDHAEAYVQGDIHTNGAENFWALTKRMLKGTYV